MKGRPSRNVRNLSPRAVKVHLSEEARRAFGDLSAAVHFSDHFHPQMLLIVDDFAKGTNFSVEDVITSLPSIAEEVFRHIHATGDERAREAWHSISEALAEHGFTLANDQINRDLPRL